MAHDRNGGLLLLESPRPPPAPLPPEPEPPTRHPYDPLHPTEFQDLDWTCSAASLAWALSSVGRPTSEQQAVSLLHGRIDNKVGLYDRTGRGICDALSTIGVQAVPRAVDWADVTMLADGNQPIMMGGVGWYHWSGLRWYKSDAGLLMLANPAPGWKLVYQTMDRRQFIALGAWNTVEFYDW